MQIAYSLLADAAQFTSDGRLWIIGGDIDTLFASSFPYVHPSLTIVLKLRVSASERAADHRLRVYLSDATTEESGREANFMFSIPEGASTLNERLRGEALDVGVGLPVVFQQLRFEHEGHYAIHIVVDDSELMSLPLKVIPQELAALRVEVTTETGREESKRETPNEYTNT